ncbi:hypothetical protein ACYSNO_07850 [Enterococcus sp. LJL98]
MDKQLRKIYDARYRTPLFLLILGILLLYLGSGILQVSNWKNTKNYLESTAFVEEFNKKPEYYDIGYDNEMDQVILPKNIEEYQTYSLQVYQQSFIADPNDPSENVFGDRYQAGVSYWKKFDAHLINLSAYLIFLIGFCLFFIDLKGNYNQFLFSLSWTKKALFQGKIRYFALPLFATLALSILGNILLTATFIPQKYMNATLLQLLYSGLSHWMFLALAFAGGLLLGTLLGNLVLGPIVVGLVLVSFLTTSDLYGEVTQLIHYFTSKTIWFDFESFFVMLPGKTGTPWWALLSYGALTVLALFFAEKVYQQTSLENNGQMLTVPTLRLPVFIILTLLSSLWFVLPFANWSYSLVNREHNAPSIVSSSIIFIFCLLTSLFLVYIDVLPKHWDRFMRQRAFRKANGRL